MEYDIEILNAKLYKNYLDRGEIEKALMVARNIIKNLVILNKCLELTK